MSYLIKKNYIRVVDHFKYPGSIVSKSVTDDRDVDTRILKDGNAFGSIWKSIILPISLYGAEYWCLNVGVCWCLQKFCNFHNRCLRAMCRVTRMQTRLFGIIASELLQRLSLPLIDVFVSQRKLRWAGHVMCMWRDRFPRKMISSRICSKRPKCCPKLTYGWSLKKCLKKADVDTENWHVLLLDCDGWRDVINNMLWCYQ